MRRLPALRRSRRFLLTPLIDVIFLLLVFFMLSSRLAPYALLPLGQTANATPTVEGEASEPRDTAGRPGTRPTTVLSLSRGHVRTGARTIPLADLPNAIQGLMKSGATEAVILPTPSATTQDLATALEAFRAAAFPRLQLIGRPPGGGTALRTPR